MSRIKIIGISTLSPKPPKKVGIIYFKPEHCFEQEEPPPSQEFLKAYMKEKGYSYSDAVPGMSADVFVGARVHEPVYVYI